MNVIGIIPKYPLHSQNNIYGRVRMPPVGIISVLSQLDEDVYAIDENNYSGPLDFTGMPDHNFLQKRKKADIAMFYGGMSNSIPRLYSLAKQYKRFGAITIAGGSHVDAMPEEALRSGVDIVVHGEGEQTAIEIMDAVKDGLNNQNLESIVGISFLKNNKVVFTGKREPIQDLDSLKDIDLTLIKFLRKKMTAVPVNRGRGCNFRCEFCVVNKQYGRYKASSNEKLLRQIIKHSDMGYKSFFVTDDNFAQNPDEAIELCKMIGDYKRKFGKKIRLMVQVRSEVAGNDELIEAMRYAGIDTLAIGYESPINEELKAMRKGVTVEKLVERSRKLSNNFYLHGMFIFGYPGSGTSLTLKQRAKEYMKFFRKARIDTIQVLNAVPLPGSELRATLEKDDRLFPLEMVGWDKYDGQFLCYIPEEDAYELQKLPRLLMKKRYMGDFINRYLNYGNWLDWAYNASIGFPIQFGWFYTKRFVSNLVEGRKERKILPEKNIFYETLENAFSDIKRRWRNLAIKTYAAGIIRRWMSAYKKDKYESRLKKFVSKV